MPKISAPPQILVLVSLTRWGIKPEYMQVERIVNHDRKKLYFVKWKELGYEDCTWEDASKVHPGVEDWQKKVCLMLFCISSAFHHQIALGIATNEFIHGSTRWTPTGPAEKSI